MTKLESVLAQALEMEEEDRELLVIQVSQSLGDVDSQQQWNNPALIAYLREVSKHADEHPETVLDWEAAEKEIFGDLLNQ